jgi:hypothetical protein
MVDYGRMLGPFAILDKRRVCARCNADISSRPRQARYCSSTCRHNVQAKRWRSKHRDKWRASKRQWRKANHEKEKERRRQYRENNREKIREARQLYNAKPENRQRRIEYRKKYQQTEKYREKHRESSRQYRFINPDAIRLSHQKSYVKYREKNLQRARLYYSKNREHKLEYGWLYRGREYNKREYNKRMMRKYADERLAAYDFCKSIGMIKPTSDTSYSERLHAAYKFCKAMGFLDGLTAGAQP